MLVSICGDTIEPSDRPSVIRMTCAISGGRPIGRPAIAAAPTAIIAPEINPPGNSSHLNKAPPATPMRSVSHVWRMSRGWMLRKIRDSF